MKKYVPNIFTFLNMVFGLVALIFVFKNRLDIAAYFVFLGIFFDFFDGFFARLFHVQTDVGLQLDSLADLITSGVVPGMVVFILLAEKDMGFFDNELFYHKEIAYYFPFFSLILILAAGYRLAKFNVDTRQSDSFIGVPTPAMSIFVMSIPLIILHSENQFIVNMVQSKWFLLTVILGFSYLMNSNIYLFALKFKKFDLKTNLFKYIFLIVSLLLLFVLNYTAIPLVIIFYILLSIGKNMYGKRIKNRI